jgi:SOS-response transcriptional repressor LexA
VCWRPGEPNRGAPATRQLDREEPANRFFYLVRETKGGSDIEKLRFETEGWKIKFGLAHFDAIGVDYALADKPESLIVPSPAKSAPISVRHARRGPGRYRRGCSVHSHLPVYSLEAAAGYFGNGHDVELEGWVEVGGRLDESMFFARSVGRSMEPWIADGDLCVFRAGPAGTRQGKILLVQYQGPADPDTGGAYAVKRYRSEKVADEATGELAKILVTLSPENPAYDPTELTPELENDVQVIAEFVGVVGTEST